MIKKLKGPDGIVLELDSSQIFPDDPGQGTPAMVEYKGGYATFNCAQSTGVVDGGRKGDIQLPDECVEWLDSDEVESQVEEMYDAGEDGEW